MTLKAVIFDFDGVLADSEPIHYQAFQEVLVPLRLGHSYQRYLEHFIGFDDRDAFREAFREANLSLTDVALADLIRAKSAAFKNIVARGIQPFPGAVSLVADLVRNEVLLAIASGALREEILMILKALNLQTDFSIIVAADDVKRSKPDPESYQLAYERLKKLPGQDTLRRQDCLVIEDTAAGIKAAKRAGMFCLAVTHTTTAEGLSAADHIANSLEELNYALLAEALGRKST